MDDDRDGDGVPNAPDNCADTANADQADFDEDGIGDECDLDADADGFNNDDDCGPSTRTDIRRRPRPVTSKTMTVTEKWMNRVRS